MSRVTETTHGHYLLKVMQIGNAFRGVALLGQQKILDAQAPKRDDCFSVLKTRLDARDQERRGARANGIPSAEEFAEAIHYVGVKGAAQRMLAAHRAAPGRALTATQLAAAGGYKKFTTANLKYGELGRSIAEHLGYELPEAGDTQSAWISVIAEPVEDEAADASSRQDPQFRWRLREEVAAALGIIDDREAKQTVVSRDAA